MRAGRRLCFLEVSLLNESPSEKEGKSLTPDNPDARPEILNESPSEKEGKWVRVRRSA